MNQVHLHLLMNHLPILGVPFGLLLLCAGMLRQSDELKKAALLTFVVAALLAVPVYFTGEPAEISVRSGRLVVLYAGLVEDSDLFSRQS